MLVGNFAFTWTTISRNELNYWEIDSVVHAYSEYAIKSSLVWLNNTGLMKIIPLHLHLSGEIKKFLDPANIIDRRSSTGDSVNCPNEPFHFSYLINSWTIILKLEN